MEKQFEVQGMTCNGCVASVKFALESVEGVEAVEVTLNPGQAVVKMKEPIDTAVLQDAVGHYRLVG
ncbi:MAG TPA: heavy metal-associated domain-containing protein [Saprospiraceae bacterium]|nr:heavy metal-associated domain-containing protein [Saprospiraceae bacterium]HMQ82020.1 heavy metal-associated domain-containing protein [Saprospiraceae bacterium]